jgi:hypothetical protein
MDPAVLLGQSLAFFVVLFLLVYRVRETVKSHSRISAGALLVGIVIWLLGVTATPSDFASFAQAFLGTIGGLTVTALILEVLMSDDRQTQAQDLRDELALDERVKGLIATYILKAQVADADDLFSHAGKLAEDARNAKILDEEEYEEMAYFFKLISSGTSSESTKLAIPREAH